MAACEKEKMSWIRSGAYPVTAVRVGSARNCVICREHVTGENDQDV